MTYLRIVIVLLLPLTIYAADPLEKFFVCEKSQDCVVAQADSCDCGASGTNTAINKAKLKQWNEKLDKEGEDSGCLTALSDDWTCTKKVKAVCLKKKCTLVEDK